MEFRKITLLLVCIGLLFMIEGTGQNSKKGKFIGKYFRTYRFGQHAGGRVTLNLKPNYRYSEIDKLRGYYPVHHTSKKHDSGSWKSSGDTIFLFPSRKTAGYRCCCHRDASGEYCVTDTMFFIADTIFHVSGQYKFAKDCDDFNLDPCPYNSESQIIVKFNLDSANGGFSPMQIKNVEAINTRKYSLRRAPLPEYYSFEYNPSSGIFKVFKDFYCCNSDSAFIKFLNNNTGTTHTIDNVRYSKSRPHDYCCGEYYFIDTFKYDGITKNRADTIIINND